MVGAGGVGVVGGWGVKHVAGCEVVLPSSVQVGWGWGVKNVACCEVVWPSSVGGVGVSGWF